MDNEYKQKIKSLLKYLSIYVIFYIVAVFPIYIRNENDLQGLNTVLCFFALPCSILYLRIRRKDNIFLYSLFFANIVLEHIFITLFKIEIVVIPFLSMFIIRKIYLFLILKKDIMDRFFGKINKSRFAEVAIVLSVGLLMIEIEIERIFPFTLDVINALMIISVFLSYIIAVKISINAFKSKNFIDTIYSIAVIILELCLVVSGIFALIGINETPSQVILFFCAYNILLVGIFVEVTYILAENSKLNDDVKEIKEYDRLRELFFANLSHELKTPINIIFSCNQVLEGELKKDDKAISDSYRKYSPMIKQNCYRLIRLTNNLVDITKIRSQFLKMNFHNYDIVQLIENIVLSIVPYAENKGINVIFDTFVEELEVKCDSDSIERIILNLLSNAIKFSSKDCNILVIIDCDTEYVEIKVIDNGIGIPDDKIDKIFDTFVQGDKEYTRVNEGSGIGLSLVKSLVELHDGIVFIGDNSAYGTEIVVKIPNITLKEEVVSMHIDNNDIINKINIEFSDIYE